MLPSITEALASLKVLTFRTAAIVFLVCLVLAVGLPEPLGINLAEAQNWPYLDLLTVVSGCATIVFLIEWLWGKWQKHDAAKPRTKPMLKLTVRPAVNTTWWSESKAPNGRVSTALCADIHAFNQALGDVGIVAFDVYGWRFWGKKIISRLHTISDPLGGRITSSKHPIKSGQLADIKLHVIVDGRLHFQKGAMMITFELTDHQGMKNKINVPLFQV